MTEFNDIDLKDLAEKGSEVDFRVAFLKDGMSKAGNPMITVGLSCTDSTGLKCKPLLYNWLVGTEGAARFIDEFVDSLDEEMKIVFENDAWICDFEKLKERTGKALLSLDDKGYVRGSWVKAEREDKDNPQTDCISEEEPFPDEEVPF